MHLTPVMLERSYEYLRATPPFNRLRMPSADAVQFAVVKSKPKNPFYGRAELDRKNPALVEICCANVKTTFDLISTMAHEMVHVHLRETSPRLKNPYAPHGRKFQTLAAAVCRQHGFDPKTF